MVDITMTVGEQFPEILLNIVQEKLCDADIDGAINLLQEVLPGISHELCLSIISGKKQMSVDVDNQTIVVGDGSVLNPAYYNWSEIMSIKLKELDRIASGIRVVLSDIMSYTGGILKIDFLKDELDIRGDPKYSLLIMELGYCIINDFLLDDKRIENFDQAASDLLDNDVKEDDSMVFLCKVYSLFKLTKELVEKYKKYKSIFSFLIENGIIEFNSVRWHSFYLEQIYQVLVDFLRVDFTCYSTKMEEKRGKSAILNRQEEIIAMMTSDKYFNEFISNGAIESEILDGYDAGWLSPDGKFYGTSGLTSSLLHLQLAEKLRKSSKEPEIELEREGWMKIHYGTISFYRMSPSDKQIEMICDYADKFYDRKLTINSPGNVINTVKLRQIEPAMLLDVFS